MSLSALPAENADKGRHYEFIKSAVNDTFKIATANRVLALAATPLKVEAWYTEAPPAYLSKLDAANLKAWDSQNQVDHLLAKTDLYAFAEPLLKARIKERHGIEPDVKNTFLRLYLPKEQPWYAIDTSGGIVTHTVSLLDAALHNFASSETVGDGSDYISRPDERGLFDIVPIKSAMPISQFQTLCRDLDIGAQFKKHLESYLLPGEPLAESVLQYKVNESQKDALAVAAHVALIKEDIQYDAYKMLLSLAGDKPQLLLNGRSMQCSDLSLLGTRLTGVLVLTHTVSDSRGIRRLIVYIPHDPDHPLKEYSSLKAFRDELVRQFREDRYSESTQLTYRQFFSQFVDHQQRGLFLAELEQRLFIVRYHPRQDPTDQRPAWRKDPRDNPNLQFGRVKLQGDYWRHAYQQKLNKILNDSREIAVSTADTDSNARWAWWDNFKKIVSDIFNVALMIATPFVPGLGELMMAYTAYQLTTEVVEGLVDLAEGLWQEVAEHVIGVVTDLIQLAAFSAGAQIGDAFKIKLSPLVEGMKPVRLPDGKPALWHPDLTPYEQKRLNLPATAQPDNHGLHQQGSDSLLPLEGKLYRIEKASPHPESRTHRIKHPDRVNAYRPTLEHNEHGAWLHEAEHPSEWSDIRLMQRMGYKVERFSPAQLEQIRISSGTEHQELRRMHSDHSPPPPLLADAINRFTAYDDTQIAIERIRAGQPIDPQSAWFETIATAIPGWPPERAIQVEHDPLQWNGPTHKYGNPAATDADTLTISHHDLVAGRLPERLVTFLDDTEMHKLLGRDVPAADRPQALRNVLADAVRQRQGEVSEYLYRFGERSRKVDVRVLRRRFPDLPLPLAEKLLSQARATDLRRIADESHLPLGLKARARELDFEAAAARAYDGFYHDEKMLPDTERLALNTLRFYSDTFSELRIEVRDGTRDGPLRCSAGPQDAVMVRQLIRHQFGQYEVLDGNGRSLHEPGDFFRALLNALPDQQRTALGYTRNQGRLLKDWIMEKSAPPAERRTLLAQPPIRPVVPLETQILLRGWPRLWRESTPEERLQKLYPKMNERELKAFLNALQNKGDPGAAITRLESDLEHLRKTLQSWRDSYPPELDNSGEPIPGVSTDYLRNGGKKIEDALMDCFKREGKIFGERSSHPDQGYTLDLSSDFPGPNLDRHWQKLRQRPGIDLHLARIRALKLDNARFSAGADGLLDSFPHLHQLSARQCALTDMPPAIGRMRELRDLDLADNNIASPESISELTRLETLNLNGNPLRRAPDVGQMNRLHELSLANTRLEDWPEGLFKVGAQDKPRPRRFLLDMRDTPIRHLPEVTPGSVQAFILSRARFDRSRLAADDVARLEGYRQSTGFARQQAFEPAAADELRYWQQFPDDRQAFGPSQAFQKYREESWHDLRAEPESEGFFSVIRHQRLSKDYRDERSRRRLTKRVWDMIEAAALDTPLREKLFKQIVSPDDCGDLGAQLFNSLGMKVLVSKAYEESHTPEELDTRLVRLARSAARLQHVSEAAREEVRLQTQQNLTNPNYPAPDEVEVHLAYETGLAQRLDLPWQSDGMLYQPRSGVNQQKINAAHDTIIKREEGDGLVNAMIELDSDPFWERHLRTTHPDRYTASDQLAVDKLSWLDELRDAQAQWAKETDVARLSPLAKKMTTLANDLGLDEKDIFSGEAMSQASYDACLSDIAYSRNDLSRQLTREALARAGL